MYQVADLMGTTMGAKGVLWSTSWDGLVGGYLMPPSVRDENNDYDKESLSDDTEQSQNLKIYNNGLFQNSQDKENRDIPGARCYGVQRVLH